MTARDRFEQTRKAVVELDTIKALIMTGGDDWKPEGVKQPGTSDPTASRAIYNVDEWGEQLEELRHREAELEDFIGVSLSVIEAVRKGFGEIYANLIDWRYIDGMTWKQIHDDYGVLRTSGQYLISIAFDWIDSVGVSRLLRNDFEV